MKIGLVGKNNTKGLGTLTRSFVQNLPITKLIVVKDQHVFAKPFLHAFEIEAKDIEKSFNALLVDLDLVIFLETFYRIGLQICRSRQIHTILVVNYEYLPEIVSPLPDLFLCSSSLNFDNTPYENKVLLPIPIDDKKFTYNLRVGPASLLYHQSGSDGLHGFNGTALLLKALDLLNPVYSYRLIISQPPVLSEGAIPVQSSNPHVKVLTHSPDIEESQLYSHEYHGFVSLQSIRATSLPIQEAMTCGLPVITTNMSPFDSLIGVPDLLVPVSHYVSCSPTQSIIEGVGRVYSLAGKTYLNPKVKSAELSLFDIVKTLEHFLSSPDISGWSQTMKANARAFSWTEMRPHYMKLFQLVVGSYYGSNLVKFQLDLSKITSFVIPSVDTPFYHDSNSRLFLVITARSCSKEEKEEKSNFMLLHKKSEQKWNVSLRKTWYNYIFEMKAGFSDYPDQVQALQLMDLKSIEIISLPSNQDYIIYIGNFEIAAFSTENHIARSFDSQIGVLRLQENRLTTWDVQRWISLFSTKPLFVLYTRTWKIEGNVLELWNWLADQEIKTVSYHLDLYVGLSRERQIAKDSFWKTQYVFTADGDPKSAHVFRSLGINHIFLKAGVFSDQCYLSNQVRDPLLDVVFVGTLNYHAEWPYRAHLIQFLTNTYKEKFHTFGNSSEIVREHRLNTLYANSKVVVGDTLCKNFKHTHYWSDRVYETLGRGGFLIHPFITGMEQEFTDKEHLVFYRYGDFKQLQTLIDFYLLHPMERERIRQAGHNLVRTQCTYKQRLQTLVNTVTRLPPSQSNFSPLSLQVEKCKPEFIQNGKYIRRTLGHPVINGDSILLYHHLVDGWLKISDSFLPTITKDKELATTFQVSVLHSHSHHSHHSHHYHHHHPYPPSGVTQIISSKNSYPIMIHDTVQFRAKNGSGFLFSTTELKSPITNQGGVKLAPHLENNLQSTWKVLRDLKLQIDTSRMPFWYETEKIGLRNSSSGLTLHSHFYKYDNGDFEVTCFANDNIEWSIEKI